MSNTMTATAAVPVRTPDFEARVHGVPKYFAAGGDIVMSHVLTVLSSVFPDGEEYFVDSVKAVADRVADPALRANIEGFIGQESMHGQEHRALNEHLAGLGYPTRQIGAYVRRLASFRERFHSDTANVGFTAALEHYTATLAEMLLSDEQARTEIGDDTVRELLLWHALEEAEHKAVAFDVYRAIGGSEFVRMATMWITHLTFVLETSIWTMISLWHDPNARRRPGRVLAGVWRLRRSRFVSRRPAAQLMQYTHRGFHPDDRDTTELISVWRERLFGTEGEVSELVAG